jgi:DnaK suppressor protein
VDTERARQRLSQERKRIEQDLAAMGHDPVSDEPPAFGDQATELDQAERDLAIREQLRETLQEIDAAERRIEEGTYGVSVVSGTPIPDARLEAIPWADRTVEEESRIG